MTAVLDAALTFHAAGCSVVRAATDGTKAPLGRWEQYQQYAADERQLHAWFGNGHAGIGIVCGAVSGNLEMLELEGRAVESGLLNELTAILTDSGLGDLWQRILIGYCERTPSGGIHILYRITGTPVPGNTKLARRHGPVDPATGRATIEVLIETRGEGGFVVTAPSNGSTHLSGQPWTLVSGGPAGIATISADEHEALHTTCRGLDEMPQPTPVLGFTQPAQRQRDSDTLLPGEDYNQRAEWPQILTGWTLVYQRGNTRYWRRPGKDRGISATTGRNDGDNLYVFSSSTEFDQERAYSKFAVYALIHHRGDYKAAAKDLAGQGYGKLPEPKRATITEPPAEQTGDWLASESLTDLGNALRLAAAYGPLLRHVPAWNKWYVWDGKRWALDLIGQAARWAKAVARRINDEAKAEPDEDVRKKLLASARRAESAHGIRAMLELAGTEPGIALAPDQLDAYPDLLNTASGILDLRTGQLGPHNPELHLTKICRAAYQPEAEAPEFTKFLERVQPQPDMREFLARLLGHTLTGRVTEHLLAILHGIGANGKTTLTEIVRKVLGDYASTTDPGLLIDRGDSHPTGIADLFGLRLAITHETDSGRRLAEGTIKRLTGGDRIKARRMREDFWEFDPTHSILMVTNHRPIVTGDDEGIWRRLRLIPFEIVIPEDERDSKLPERLEAEMDGILGWLVAGYREYLTRGLGEPQAVISATNSYRKDSDALGRFIDERCLIMTGSRVKSSELFAAWAKWCTAENVDPGTQTAFSARLGERGFDKSPIAGRIMWRGIGLQDETDEGGWTGGN